MVQTRLDLFKGSETEIKKKIKKLKQEIKEEHFNRNKRKELDDQGKLIGEYEQACKHAINGNFVITSEAIKKAYNNKEINKQYALQVLKILIYQDGYTRPKFFRFTHDGNYITKKQEFEIRLTLAIKALKIACQISQKNKKLFNFLEEIIISDSWSKLRMEAMFLLAELFPERAKKPISHVVKNEETIQFFFTRYYKIRRLRKISKYIEDPVIKLYFYDQWFFNRYDFKYNVYEKRIFGASFSGQNYKLKIQNFNCSLELLSDYKINNETLTLMGDKNKTLKEYDLNQINNLDVIKHEYNGNVIKIYSKKGKFYYGIRRKFFNKIINDLKKLYKLQDNDFRCVFYQNYSVLTLFVAIKKLQVGIVFPATRFLFF